MKPLELTITLRNNRLQKRRDALQVTQAQIAEMVGISLATYAALEGLRASPQFEDRRGAFHWRDAAIRLAEFHGTTPETLFPQSVLAVRQPRVVREVTAEDVARVLTDRRVDLPTPLELVDGMSEGRELARDVDHALATLTDRERAVLEMRFGLRGQDEGTLDDVAGMRGVTRERVRQIEAKALRKLRHPSISKRLAAHLTEGQQSELKTRELNALTHEIEAEKTRILQIDARTCYGGGGAGCPCARCSDLERAIECLDALERRLATWR